MARKRGNGDDSIYKSGGRWYVQGFIDEGDRTVRRKVSATTKTAALAKWAERRADAARGAQRHSEYKTVGELLQHWIDVRSLELRYTTVTGYRHSIASHLIPYLGAMELKAVTAASVEHWQYQLSAGKKLSYSAVHQARVILKQAFDMAVRHRVLAGNPVTIARAPKKKATRIDPMTEAQAQQLLRSIAHDDAHARVRVLLAITLGLRQGELLALRWKDLDLTSSEPHLVVRASLQRQTGKGLVRVEPKTEKSRRTIRLSGPHLDALKALALQQKALRLKAGGTFNPEGYVLVSSTGTPIDPANDRKLWLRLLKSAGLPSFRVHSSRHTAVTLLLKQDGLADPEALPLLVKTFIEKVAHVAGPTFVTIDPNGEEIWDADWQDLVRVKRLDIARNFDVASPDLVKAVLPKVQPAHGKSKVGYNSARSGWTLVNATKQSGMDRLYDKTAELATHGITESFMLSGGRQFRFEAQLQKDRLKGSGLASSPG